MNITFISYPKSGRTWMRYVFHLMNCPITFTHAGTRSSMGANEMMGGNEAPAPDPALLGDKNIFMYRNPLDTTVSLYFQIHKWNFKFQPFSRRYWQRYFMLAKKGKLPPKDMDAFVLDPFWGCESVCKFNRAWIDFLENKPNALIINYEDARSDPKGMVEKLIDFIGLPSQDVERIVEESSFSSMKKLESSGKGKRLRLRGKVNGDPEGMKVRKGIVKGYTQYLRAETINAAKNIAARYQLET